jgi:[acyl-carrier-protein] S-malonyltransferase
MMRTVLLFPGQGSHEAGMEEAVASSELLAAGLALLDYDPFARLDEGTRYQQPALFLCDVAAWELAGRPDALSAAGHSLGEYAALTAAGALAFGDALHLVDIRAAAMAAAGDREAGGMAAVLGGEADDVHALAGRLGLVVANDNAPGQIVLAGPVDAVAQVEAGARDIGARCRVLPVSGAFHSPLIAAAQAQLRGALAATPVAPPRFPVYSNGTAAPFADVRAELAENLVRPVRFRETILAMQDAGAEEFVELGPGRVLTGLVKRALRAAA